MGKTSAMLLGAKNMFVPLEQNISLLWLTTAKFRKGPLEGGVLDSHDPYMAFGVTAKNMTTMPI